MGFDFNTLDLHLNLQTTCSISDDSFLKLLNLTSKSDVSLFPYLERNFGSVSDNYRFMTVLIIDTINILYITDNF